MHNRILLSSNDESNILYVSETIIDNEFKATKHSHPNLEILCITKGEGTIHLNDEQLFIKSGDILIINSNLKHYEASLNQLQFYAVGINHLSIFSKDLTYKVIKCLIQSDDFKALKKLFSIIYYEAINKKTDYLELITYSLNSIIKIINRNNDLSYSKNNNDNCSSYISSIKQFIDNFFYLSLSLEEISEKVSLSIPYMCQIFKKETSQTIFEYKLNKQISEAKNLLEITDLSISEIANGTGFSNSSYFSKTFKTIEGVTPKQYKQNKKFK